MKRVLHWMLNKQRRTFYSQALMALSMLILVVFIVFDVRMQRKALEDSLLNKGISMAWTGAGITSHVLEDAIQRGVLTEAQVFDTHYIEIQGSDPLRYHTAYDDYLDAHLQKMEDMYLEDIDVTYAVASDVNGYVPTHNSVFSQPLTGDFEHDLQFSRSKRMFDDEIGLNASQNKQPYLLQIYHRDTGEILWDISAPIMVDGRHWGAFRVGFSLDNIDAKLKAAENRVIFPAFWVICGLGLAVVWIGRLQDRLEKSNQDLQQEIEQRKSAQTALAEENELFSITLSSMGDAVITIDHDGIVQSFNPAAEKLTGFSMQEALGAPFYQVFRLIDYPPQVDFSSALEVARKQGAEEYVPILLNKAGDKVILEKGVYPFSGKEQRETGYVILARNITKKFQDEIQSILSQKMESIGHLASGIAHEINTPIQYVGDNINYLKRVFQHYDETLDFYRQFVAAHQENIQAESLQSLEAFLARKKISHYQADVPEAIREAQEGIERVRKIVLALREFTHPSVKDKKMADINQGIRTTVTISRNEWKYIADVELDLDENMPLVLCQIDEINQVILNMIVNSSHAIRQMAEGQPGFKGKINIKTQVDGDNVSIIIQDTGRGIPEKIINRIFDPFFTTKEVNEGTGQGLALAHNIIVKNHHGKIYVDSTVGKGTTFFIELPVHGDVIEQPHIEMD